MAVFQYMELRFKSEEEIISDEYFIDITTQKKRFWGIFKIFDKLNF